ncbi:CpaF family protein [Nocardioides sp.]|uniref:CpaF family protein n=1 Tax=Nocardioides sp. TaxID=35761 RepID=UPI0027374897|nr:CpaF/VirB11 family protein [Nocardioides sp.]MDP3893629.1 CpaF/VirB11 family protein [Nocardioides sp.]
MRAFRAAAGKTLSQQTVDREGIDDNNRRELGRKIILDLLAAHARDADERGAGGGFDADYQQRLSEAVFNSLFGLGRLQPLVDNPELENIEIIGCDRVHLIYADGRIEEGPAVADSDEELIEHLQFLAARAGQTERPFSPSNPDLDLRLPGGARLAASAWTTPRPTVVIRRHRLVDVDLDDLVRIGMLDAGLAGFLRAAVRGRRSIVVAGGQGAGKTTLVRALCNEIGPMESIGTMETEYELHLHEMGTPDNLRHPRCKAWEARPGSGERGPDGRRLGEITLDDIMWRSLRMNLDRVIVGEVRGREVFPMIKAMQAGSGSLSTTHANSAHAAIERLVTCATEAGPQVSETWAYRQVAQHIDLIVQVAYDYAEKGPRARYISEVIAVEPGEDARPAVTDVYVPGTDGRARPKVLPQWLRSLSQWGADLSVFRGEGVA